MTTLYPTTQDQFAKPFLLSFSVVTSMLRNLVASQYFIEKNFHGLMTFDNNADYGFIRDLIFVPYNSKLGFIKKDIYQLLILVNIRREPIDLFLIKHSIVQQGKEAILKVINHYLSTDHFEKHRIHDADILGLRLLLLITHQVGLMAKDHRFFDHRVVTENTDWRFIPLRDRIVLSGPNADIEVLYPPKSLALTDMLKTNM